MAVRSLVAALTALGLMVIVVPAHAAGDDGLVAFTTGGGEEPAFVWTARPDGSDRRRLLGPRKRLFRLGASGPKWSKDGRRLLFGGHWRLDEPPRSLWRATASGRRVTRIPLGFRRTMLLHGWDWAPDGRRVVFAARRGKAAPMMYTMRLDGRHRRPLRRGWWPQWSADGRHIVFTIVRSLKDPLGPPRHSIGVIRPDGTGFRLLTPFDHDAMPSLSPDGRRIAFVRNAFAPGQQEEWRVADIDGGGDVVVPRPPGDFGWHAPAWAPDGERLAVVRSELSGVPDQPVSRLVSVGIATGDLRVHFRLPDDFPGWTGVTSVAWRGDLTSGSAG